MPAGASLLGEDGFDEVVSGGIFENRRLQKVLTGEEPPFVAVLGMEEPAFDFKAELSRAEFKLTEEESKGWRKLGSLDR